MFGDLAVFQPVDVDLSPLYLLPGWRDAIELPGVHGAGLSPFNHPISVRYQVLDRGVSGREPGHDHLAQCFDSITARGQSGVRQMVDEIRGHQFIDNPLVGLVLKFLDESADDLQVVLPDIIRFR